MSRVSFKEIEEKALAALQARCNIDGRYLGTAPTLADTCGMSWQHMGWELNALYEKGIAEEYSGGIRIVGWKS